MCVYKRLKKTLLGQSVKGAKLKRTHTRASTQQHHWDTCSAHKQNKRGKTTTRTERQRMQSKDRYRKSGTKSNVANEHDASQRSVWAADNRDANDRPRRIRRPMACCCCCYCCAAMHTNNSAVKLRTNNALQHAREHNWYARARGHTHTQPRTSLTHIPTDKIYKRPSLRARNSHMHIC